MAKICEHCKQPYPDNLDHCPHCAPAVELVDENETETFLLHHDEEGHEAHAKAHPEEAPADEAVIDFAALEESGPPSGSSGVVLGLEPEDVAPGSPSAPAKSDSAVDLVHPAEDLETGGRPTGRTAGDSHTAIPANPQPPAGEPLSDVYLAEQVPSAEEAERAGPVSDVYPAGEPVSDVYPAGEPMSDVYPAGEPMSDVFPAEETPAAGAHSGPAGEAHAGSEEEPVAEAWVVEEAEGSAVHLDAARPAEGSSSGLDFLPADDRAADGSAIDLGALDHAGSSTSAVSLGGTGTGKESSAGDLAGPGEPSGSAINLESSEEPTAPAGDLHFVPEALEPGSSEVYMRGSEEAAHTPAEGSSGLNLFGEEPTAEAHVVEEAQSDEEVTFAEEGPASARDIVEEVESGVDLDRPRAGAAAEAGSEHDSAVDLGGESSAVVGHGSASGDSAFHAGEHADDAEAAALLADEGEHPAFEEETLTELPGAEAHDEEAATVPAEEAGESGGRRVPALASRPPLVPWVGGGLIGAGAMVVLFAALWALNLLPSRQAARPPANQVTTGPAQPQAVAPPAPTLDLGQTELHGGDFSKALETFGQLEKGNAENPAFLTARGEALWLKTLQQLHEQGKPVTPQELAQNPDVAKAKTDLEKAGTADALFWLGMIQGQTDGPDAARKTFEQAMAKYPDQKRRFQAAIDRLDLEAPDQAAGAARLAPAPGRAGEMYWVSAALIALQAPQTGGTPAPAPAGAAAPGQPAPPAGGAASAADEAGYDFWAAVKLARENKYPQALAALDKARSLHDRLRYTRLGRAQNPNSDPYEDIFLRACDELKVSWQVRAKLAEAGYLDTAHRASPRAVLAAVDRATKGEADVKAARKQVEQIVAALKDAGVKDDDPVKGVADLDAMCKKAEKQVGDVAAALKAAGVKADDPAKGVADLEESKKKADKQLDEVAAALKTAGVKSDDPVKGVADLEESKKTVQKEMDRVAAALKTAGIKEADPLKGTEAAVAALGRANGELDAVRTKLVEGRYLPPSATRADVPRGLDGLMQATGHPVMTAVARMVDDVSGTGGRIADGVVKTLNTGGELAACRVNTVRLEAQLAERWTPEQMLNVWLAALGNRPNPALADDAMKDAQRVLGEKSMPAAVCVRALAERSKGEYAKARQDLQEVRKASAPPGSHWLAVAQTNLRQLSDPSAFYLPRVRDLRADKKYADALATLDQALRVFSEDAFPADHASLLALRGEVRLDQARSGGAGERPPAALLRASEVDAQAAVKGGDKVEGNYAQGRVAELRGEMAKAEALYRQSLEAYDAAAKDRTGFARAHPVSDPLGNRYREALSRVLLLEVRRGNAVPPKQEARPEGARTIRLDSDQVLAVVRPVYGDSCVQLAAACLTLLQPAGGAVAPVAPPDERLQEALRLADQMIAAGDYRGYLLRGEVLGRTHHWDEALRATEEGIRKALPRQEAAPLEYVLENHPAFQRREGVQPPDPLLAEEHYGTGLVQYFDGHYAQAERNFADAVYYNDQDARYLYFLGLARLAQPGKRDVAMEDFRQAGRLEAQNRPSSAAVSIALQRVQGPARQILNHVRDRAIEEATAKAQ